MLMKAAKNITIGREAAHFDQNWGGGHCHKYEVQINGVKVLINLCLIAIHYWSRSVLVLTIPATATTAAAAAILPNEGTWMLPNEGTGMLTQHLKRHFLGTRNLIVET